MALNQLLTCENTENQVIFTTLVIAYHNLAVELEFLGKIEEAIEAFSSGLRISIEKLGEKHELSANLQQKLREINEKRRNLHNFTTLRRVKREISRVPSHNLAKKREKSDYLGSNLEFLLIKNQIFDRKKTKKSESNGNFSVILPKKSKNTENMPKMRTKSSKTRRNTDFIYPNLSFSSENPHQSVFL